MFFLKMNIIDLLLIKRELFVILNLASLKKNNDSVILIILRRCRID